MADTNEEQLLNDLLRELSDADRAMAAPAIEALEARVLAGWDSAAGSGRTRTRRAVVVAGLAAALAMAIGGVWFSRGRPLPAAATSIQRPLASSQLPVASYQLPAPSFELPAASFQLPATSSRLPAASSHAISQSPITQSPIPSPQPPIPTPPSSSSMEFLPLMPLTAQELSGPFQLVRVQVPLASLGGLTSPLQHPGELIKADLLLGEDGVARGIRIAADESNYPWRFR